ncbi:hypothetical protein T492DRAFT_262445 [Pavlovales sp. CCMP2436]|nr:hypothetical protein T492DRAFT_262445 [Pavlovales sp. CCMP2436]
MPIPLTSTAAFAPTPTRILLPTTSATPGSYVIFAGERRAGVKAAQPGLILGEMGKVAKTRAAACRLPPAACKSAPQGGGLRTQRARRRMGFAILLPSPSLLLELRAGSRSIDEQLGSVERRVKPTSASARWRSLLAVSWRTQLTTRVEPNDSEPCFRVEIGRPGAQAAAQPPRRCSRTSRARWSRLELAVALCCRELPRAACGGRPLAGAGAWARRQHGSHVVVL